MITNSKQSCCYTKLAQWNLRIHNNARVRSCYIGLQRQWQSSTADETPLNCRRTRYCEQNDHLGDATSTVLWRWRHVRTRWKTKATTNALECKVCGSDPIWPTAILCYHAVNFIYTSLRPDCGTTLGFLMVALHKERVFGIQYNVRLHRDWQDDDDDDYIAVSKSFKRFENWEHSMKLIFSRTLTYAVSSASRPAADLTKLKIVQIGHLPKFGMLTSHVHTYRKS
jgi:hypothetical protein